MWYCLLLKNWQSSLMKSPVSIQVNSKRRLLCWTPQRIEIARDNKADVLLSLHADAFKTANVRGASVFAISDRGSTSEKQDG